MVVLEIGWGRSKGWKSMKPYNRNVLLKQLQRRKAEIKAQGLDTT